ncbi:hypothetical protein BGZ61DRAFT_34158 [Ilyonectria robusta]|uniref:uncharacterized protein n=1 Tax=Ilyonectria robusta TaxID=1079257 RepID=UPI001E8CAE73|nr:uncharacterized protein BGZ61DRAFT_34158 [Ilyonectria robusta]KAH8694678.1 hypothetical protein BGZ61DRAFT_34158 [Ilyonectria robusta]
MRRSARREQIASTRDTRQGALTALGFVPGSAGASVAFPWLYSGPAAPAESSPPYPFILRTVQVQNGLDWWNPVWSLGFTGPWSSLGCARESGMCPRRWGSCRCCSAADWPAWGPDTVELRPLITGQCPGAQCLASHHPIPSRVPFPPSRHQHQRPKF